MEIRNNLEKFEKYKSDSLFLLIGTNPLPNFVSFKLLAKPTTKIYFVHTSETDNIADRLLNLFNLPKDRWNKIQVDESKPNDIFDKIYKHAKGGLSLGLNYTGGTKSMAVHAYRAIQAADVNAVFSYLDARKLEMLINTKDFSTSLATAFLLKPSMKELLELHGYTIKHAEKEPFKPDLCLELAKLHPQELRKWCDNNLRSGSRTDIFGEKILKTVELPFQPPFEKLIPYYTGCKTFQELEKQWQWKHGIKELAKWFDGKWLEHYTFWALQQVMHESSVHEEFLSLKTDKHGFEIDVAVLRGYQLFAISCTTDSKKGDVKLKLFEAYVRAHQLGGDEAKIGMVCFAPHDQADNNPVLIKKEIEEEWDVKDKFRVFGSNDILTLQTHLKDWFNSK